MLALKKRGNICIVTICFVLLQLRIFNSRQGLKRTVSIPPKKETSSCPAQAPS